MIFTVSGSRFYGAVRALSRGVDDSWTTVSIGANAKGGMTLFASGADSWCWVALPGDPSIGGASEVAVPAASLVQTMRAPCWRKGKLTVGVASDGVDFATANGLDMMLRGSSADLRGDIAHATTGMTPDMKATIGLHTFASAVRSTAYAMNRGGMSRAGMVRPNWKETTHFAVDHGELRSRSSDGHTAVFGTSPSSQASGVVCLTVLHRHVEALRSVLEWARSTPDAMPSGELLKLTTYNRPVHGSSLYGIEGEAFRFVAVQTDITDGSHDLINPLFEKHGLACSRQLSVSRKAMIEALSGAEMFRGPSDPGVTIVYGTTAVEVVTVTERGTFKAVVPHAEPDVQPCSQRVSEMKLLRALYACTGKNVSLRIDDGESEQSRMSPMIIRDESTGALHMIAVLRPG